MRITHLGHACVLIEVAGRRLLVDPGSFSDFSDVHDLDAVLVTHVHADHIDVDRLPDLLRRNDSAVLVTDPQTARDHADLAVTRTLRGGEVLEVGDVRVEGVGEQHAFNHEALPRPLNTGLVVRAPGEPVLFHPGDAYDADPGPVDVLALPLSAPWCAGRDTVEFARRIAPGLAFPVHDALLSPAGRDLYSTHVRNIAKVEVRDLAGQGAAEV